MKKIHYPILMFMLILSFLIISVCMAQESKQEKPIVRVKEMVGEIVYFTPRNDPKVIAIGNNETNTDYSFIIDAETNVEHKKSLKELRVGDTVRIVYHEIVKTDKRKGMIDERVARQISFVKENKSKGIEPGPGSESETSSLVSEGENE